MKASDFKFIAWDNSGRQFVKGIHLQDAENIPTRVTKDGFKLKSTFELFQYTGLKDYRGREIYDGHRLEVVHPKLSCGMMDVTVGFENGGFMVEYFSDTIFKTIVVPLGFAIEEWKRIGYKYRIVGHVKIRK